MYIKGTKIIITDDNVEKGLRKFKKAVADSGILQELRGRQEYVKPTTRKKIARNQARARWRRYLKSQELPKQMY